MSPAGWPKKLRLLSWVFLYPRFCDTKLTPTESKSHQAFNKAKPHSSWLLSWDLHLPPKPGDCSLQQQFGDKQTADGSGRTEVSILLLFHHFTTTCFPAWEKSAGWSTREDKPTVPRITQEFPSHMVFVPPTETQPWRKGKQGGRTCQLFQKAATESSAWTPEHTELSRASLTTSDTHSDW